MSSPKPTTGPSSSHRLLSEEGVDQRIIEILARKNQLFAEFARVSETADSAPEV